MLGGVRSAVARAASVGVPQRSLGSVRSFTTSPRWATQYYEVLGYPFSTVGRHGWDVDQAELKSLWRQRMAETHPDRMVNRPESEQQRAGQHSAVVNKAYETLRHPLSRALYLLDCAGAENVSESDSIENPKLLMEVMELQEALDGAENAEAVQEIAAANEEHLRDVLERLGKAFARDPVDYSHVRQLAVELRYWDNIARAAQEWQPGQRVELHH